MLSSRRFLRPALALLTLAFSLAWGFSPALASDERARIMVDQLYTTPGSLPINDLVVELEDHAATSTADPILWGRTKMFFKAPAKLRVDVVQVTPKSPNDGKLTVIIRDGENLYVYGAAQYPAKRQADTPSPTLALPFNLQRYRRDIEREFYDLGVDHIDSVAVHRIQILSPSQPDWTAVVWIDPVRRVPLQMETGIQSEGKMRKKRVLYKDIRRLPDGRYFPFQLQIYDDDVLREVKIYKGVKINVGLDPTLFEPVREFLNQPR